MKYEFTQLALAGLKKQPGFIQKKILGNLEKLAGVGDPLDYADHLIYHEIGQFRFRIGDYRIIFDADGETLKVLAIGHKREVYE
ncbi:MAG: addiction module antitoxin [uncultured bacterium]|nr:MAG: addiction module antitoxin [uncultured bacterium]